MKVPCSRSDKKKSLKFRGRLDVSLGQHQGKKNRRRVQTFSTDVSWCNRLLVSIAHIPQFFMC